MKRFFDPRSLPSRMILSTIFVVVITALTVGLPAIWVVRGQLMLQAWEQLQRAQTTVQALYEARQIELSNLATLIAQRPTLQDLLIQENRAALQEYLSTLRVGAAVDHLLLCDPDRRPIGSSGSALPADLCRGETIPALYRLPGGNFPGLLLTATHPLIVDGRRLGLVVIANDIDQEFIDEMRLETGIEQTLLMDGLAVASSFSADPGQLASLVREDLEPFAFGETPLRSFQLDGQPYYAIRFPLSQPGLEVELAEGAGGIAAAQGSLVQSLVVGMLVSALLGILLGVLLSRQISQPLVQLARAASGFSQGDLSTPVAVETELREETLVAQALENARVNLRDTLTDLQREKAWIDQLLEAIVEGIMTLDSQKRITFFSHGAERITGWGREEVLQRSCDEVFRVAGSETPFSQFLPAPGMKSKLAVELADGHWASLSFSGARLSPSEAGEAAIALVFRDVSSEEIVHNMLGQFTANIAHEFRTPLSAVAASAEMLKDQAPVLTIGELQELTHSIHLGILSLQTLVDNLLEGASIEAGHFRISPRSCSLETIIGEAVTTMQPLLDKYEQNLVVSLPESIPPVFADPRRTLQVLVNLLSNASKYGPAEAEIALCAGVSADRVRVEVSDRGAGIPPEQRRDLFRRFVYPQAAPEHGKVGIGLGLSVVKAVVEAHGGQTGVEDRPGGGSTFWFTLPIAGST
ncbi:MAG TPA: ATP-binding protein [Anaerolineales bacterium]|nr:ATP-binding protein [Anaerolineales bacterium]